MRGVCEDAAVLVREADPAGQMRRRFRGRKAESNPMGLSCDEPSLGCFCRLEVTACGVGTAQGERVLGQFCSCKVVGSVRTRKWLKSHAKPSIIKKSVESAR